MNYLILDIATCPIEGAEGFLEEPSAPANYKDPEKIAAYIVEKKADALAKAALDPDLGCISAIGLWAMDGSGPQVIRCQDDDDERDALVLLARNLDATRVTYSTLIGFNALKFDWPFLIRRAQYLGVHLPLELDRYKSTHIDLYDRLTMKGLCGAHSLGFYIKRLGWTDLVKPLSGAEEALAPSQGKWEELEASVIHDLTATKRLAEWMGVLQPEQVAAL